MPQALERSEGCWAWVVLLASVVTQGLTLGFPTCIGIFFTELQREFQASNSETSWFPSILTAMLHAGGPLCSILVGRFGCRATMMLGGVLASLGMVAGSFCRTLGQLYLTAGFITGLGMCFSFQSSITVLGLYFTRWRVLANALASAGVSLGITLWPLLSRYLLEDLGWRGTFLIFGGVLLHCCVCGAVVKPVPASVTPEAREGLPSPSKRPSRGCLVACGRAIRRHLAFDVLRDNVLMDIVPMDRFSSALGLFTILESISILISPPLAGLLLDATDDFSYVFYMSSFFLISAALFMGGSFCVLGKKERQGPWAEVKGAVPEAAPEQGLTTEDMDGPEKRLRVEIMYVTSV
ncbi:monocarboxylate transporter 6 isoform X2 [Capricornis sumatraensis]|uniref:monocarboxylate transporter 6 isoform X2 n=1 Tax=Capricornis sumatraensis TaxID=34865 RepID=UPI003604A260